MDDEQIRLFLLVSEKGSFSKAEEAGYISKQAIMKQINRLEDEIGCTLFERTRKGVRLSGAGKVFHDGALHLIHEREQLFRECRSLMPDNFVRLGNVEHQVILDRVTAEFSQRYPDIEIRRIVHPNHSGEWRVENGIMDVGETFSLAVREDSGFTYLPLTRVPFVAAMDPSHPLAGHDHVNVGELTLWPVTLFPLMLEKEIINAFRQSFAGAPEHLILRDDVDNQVEAAFSCIGSDRILITANPFIHSISPLVKIPLQEGWHREYGIIYRPPVSHAVQKYIDLAVEIYRR